MFLFFLFFVFGSLKRPEHNHKHCHTTHNHLRNLIRLSYLMRRKIQVQDRKTRLNAPQLRKFLQTMKVENLYKEFNTDISASKYPTFLPQNNETPTNQSRKHINQKILAIYTFNYLFWFLKKKKKLPFLGNQR